MKSLLLPFLALTLFLPASQGVEAYYEKIFITNSSNYNIAVLRRGSTCVDDVFPDEINIGTQTSVMVNVNVNKSGFCGMGPSIVYFRILGQDSKGRHIYPEFYYQHFHSSSMHIDKDSEHALKVLNSNSIEFSSTK